MQKKWIQPDTTMIIEIIKIIEDKQFIYLLYEKLTFKTYSWAYMCIYVFVCSCVCLKIIKIERVLLVIIKNEKKIIVELEERKEGAVYQT